MTADKIAFARHWYEAGVCPGCGSRLEDVAGQGRGHWMPGEEVVTGKTAYPHTTEPGESFAGGNISLQDRRVCPCSADYLTSLVLIGSGTVGYHPSTDVSNRTPAGETAPSRENFPDPVASLTGHCQGGGQHES